jgi:hypothetical protein
MRIKQQKQTDDNYEDYFAKICIQKVILENKLKTEYFDCCLECKKKRTSIKNKIKRLNKKINDELNC